MKMKVRLFMSMAAAAMILAGCSNDENVVDNGPVELRLTSGITVQQTRVFTPTQDISIKEGEVVSVWVNDAGVNPDKVELYQANQLTATSNNQFTGGDAMYFPQTGNMVDIYALHGTFATPFSKGTAFPATVEYRVEADQSIAGGASYTNSDLLYACEKNVARHGNPTTKELSFYHMLSKLEVAIVLGKGSPELDAVTLSDVTLNGKFTPSTSATMSDQAARAAMLGAADTPQSGNMTLGQKTCADFTANVDYNEAIIVPQYMQGKVLTFKLKSGGELKYTISISDPTGSYSFFESGKKYIFHITLNLTGLTVTSIIEPWVDGVAKEGEATMEAHEL